MSGSDPMTSAARCVFCNEPLSVRNNLNSGLVTVNVDGHGKPAHRACADSDRAFDEGWLPHDTR